MDSLALMFIAGIFVGILIVVGIADIMNRWDGRL